MIKFTCEFSRNIIFGEYVYTQNLIESKPSIIDATSIDEGITLITVIKFILLGEEFNGPLNC